ncbi:hypothetical protein OAR31_06155, partial [Candidatus Marinimicrobia bacterium]|nr:hypothetical protein [Candidatus Neomarinimicrobiota bacterium]
EADEISGVDGFDTGSDLDLNHEFGLESDGLGRTFTDTLSFGDGYKIRFGRQISDRDRTVEFDIDGDTAIGIVSYTVSGDLFVKAFDTTDHTQIDSISFYKEFTSNFVRKVQFTQADNDENPDGYDWKVNALTPMIGGSGDKVSILSLSVYGLTDALEQGELLHHFEADGLGDMFIDRESLPTFTAFVPYMAQVAVENNGPELCMDSTCVGEWVFKNYGRSRGMRGRKHLNDKGVFLDAVMNDNIHTGGWRAHGPGQGRRHRGFRSFFETIDLATLFVDDGGYNTTVWSIPYKIERP